MLTTKNNTKSIIQVDEAQFRKVGVNGDALISILRQRDIDIKDEKTMLIRTNLTYQHQHPVINAFNSYLQMLRMSNVIAINVILD